MRDTVHFLAQTITRFRQMGALVPSGIRLARAMVREVPPLAPGAVIVELGPGTGVFTRELARRFPAARIVAVEFNSALAKRLSQAMPDIDIIHGCASALPDHLQRLGIRPGAVAAVVSGLPLLSLPHELGDAIFASIAATLSPGGRYIQFTYSKRAWRRRAPHGFRLDPTRRVWLNLPPAEVLPFTRMGPGSAHASHFDEVRISR